MKTIKSIILITILAALVFSCDNLIGLGQRLDLEGPEVVIKNPASRKAVPSVFTLEGIINDNSKPIKTILITAEKKGEAFAKQWRFNVNKWEVSENYGSGWQDYTADGLKWKVSDNYGANFNCYEYASNVLNKEETNDFDAVLDGLQIEEDEKEKLKRKKIIFIWNLPVDLSINGVPPMDDEYLFTVQTWDTSGNSADKSISTRVLIIDRDPPKADIINPVIYRGQDAITENNTLVTLHAIPDNGQERFEPANIGRFLTQGFDLQWQIEDNHDVRSVDIRFYNFDTVIDQEVSTALPGNYIYRYQKPITEEEASGTIKPSGKQIVPALDGMNINYAYDGELLNPITEKTTIKVVVTCYDAAGNPNQEKVLGYIIYWPLADEPWIIYTEDMEKPYEGNKERQDPLKHYDDLVGTPRKDNPDENYKDLKDVVEAEAFMIYPGRTIRANAYHNHGITEVNFKLYEYDFSSGYGTYNKNKNVSSLNTEGTCTSCGNKHIAEASCFKLNEPRPNGSYSTIFPWEFRPPARSGNFIVEATTTSIGGKVSHAKIALFRVQDITFPDFPEPIEPSASDPLFMHVDIDENTVTISGIVRDATMVETLDLVWINPQSANFATQNQIRFFREPDFEGWQKVNNSTNGVPSISLDKNGPYVLESVLENEAIANGVHPTGLPQPNKIWRLKLIHEGEDTDTRQVFSFSITLNLKDDLNIALDDQSLNSQTFLLKAKNPDNRSTIITYAPQGDESPPVIRILNVIVDDGNPYIPQQYALMPRFHGGETITINGSWNEDSAEYLPIDEYFSDNFEAEINGKVIPQKNITVSYNDPAVKSSAGTWQAVIEVGEDDIYANDLLDSLVLEARTKDFGGNVSSAGGSWLVESDDLRLLRISSNDDGTKKLGEKVTVFIEFSKAVQLRYTNTVPVLLLNSTGTGSAARAVYKLNESLSTRHEFEYTVSANNNTPVNSRLNVTGIEGGGSNWNQDNYPFTWVRGSGETREEIRVTMNAAHAYNKDTNNVVSNGSVTPAVTDGRLYARRLPVTDNNSDAEYQFTLGAGKNIIIDTQAPTVTGITDTITGTTAQHYKAGQDIYIKLTFSENVKVGSSLPRLQLRLINPANPAGFVNGLTSNNSNDVRVSGQDITFKYTVVAGDTTGNNPILITGHTGEITDLAGTPLAANGISNLQESINANSTTDRTIQNRFINTIKPGVPVVRLLSSNTTANDANAISNYVNGTAAANLNYGRSNASPNALSNVYHPSLWIAIQASTASATGGATFNGDNNLLANTGLEYSVIDHPTNRSWVKAPNLTNSPFEGLQAGTYMLVARQINRAGIESDPTDPITFTWDPGQLITRISSTTANGTYTNVSGRNEIDITVFFRKNVSIAAGSTITLNARRGTANSDYNTANPVVTLTGTAAVNNANSITYTYTIPNGDNTPPGVNLDVTAINITAWDGTTPNNGVSNTLNSITHLDSAMRLNGNKEFKVSTGNLTISTAPAFSDNVPGAVTGTANQSNVNYHGIREDDGSYWTTLQFTFNRNISKGDGEIVIRQNEANYRLPTVLTEAQYNRFRNIASFDTYYTRGTYGFNGTSSDTTPKYILQYRYNPQRGATSLFTGSTTDAQGPDTDTIIPNAFHDAFREEEAIKINVFNSAVTIDGATVRVRLSSANAPQVPGATYTVTIPAGFVQDELSNKSGNPNNSVNDQVYTVTLGGAARPFVRIRKTQDTIATATAGANQPRLVATQPMYAFARIDSRTPGAIIRYNANTSTLAQGATISLTTGSNGNNNSNWTPAGGPKENTTAAVPTTPTTPASSTAGTAYPSTDPTNYQIAIGNTDYQGLQWRIIARAFITGTNAASSYETQEMAYRTVLTYVVRRENAAMDTQYGSESILADGDQVWIRGGDAVDSSSIPGFPLTWADTWSELANKRAGIRLMTKVQGDSLNHSAWRWVTWDINATAYVDFIRGRDAATTIAGTTWAASSAAVAWQYGPKQIAYQRAGWTSFKTSYPVYAGQHRICDAGWDHEGKGRINFSATLNPRPASTDTNNWATTTPTTLNVR